MRTLNRALAGRALRMAAAGVRNALVASLLVVGGCTTSGHVVVVEPQALVAAPGSSLEQDTEAALEIGWGEVLQMAAHPRPRITWYLPCAVPTNAAGDVIITYAESCSASSVNARGDVALQWTGSIASSWFPQALVGLKGYDEGNAWGYYSGDRADEQRIRDALVGAGL